MPSPLTFGSLFDGIGCFSLAFVRAGFRLAWAVEIDADCRCVTRERFPGVRQYDDVRAVGGHNLEPVDVVLGGFPCQDLSVAGRRAGLAGERSGLWAEFRRVLAEVTPRWCLVENVPGLLSSNGGRDMGALLWQLGQLGYWWAYRCLDAQYDGLAQRRNRVFIVGRLGNVRGEDARRVCGLPAQVLFEPESLPGHPAPRREAGAGIAPSVTPGARRASGQRSGEQLTVYQARGAGALRAGSPSLAASDDNGSNQVVVASTLTGGTSASPGVNPPGRRKEDDYNLVTCVTGEATHARKSVGCHASEDGTGRGMPIIPIDMRQASRGATMTNNRPEGSSGGAPGTGVGEEGDPAPSLAGTHTPAVAFSNTAGVTNLGMSLPGVPPITTRNGDPGNVQYGMTVRRLTPVECCRLQGLPDDWLDVDPPLSDSAKYRMVGNGGSVPTVQWIAERIRVIEGV